MFLKSLKYIMAAAAVAAWGLLAPMKTMAVETMDAADMVLATVNGEPITLEEVDIETRFSAREGLLQQAVSGLIIEKILLQEAAKRGMTLEKIPRQEVLDQMAQEKRKLIQLFGSTGQDEIDKLFRDTDFNAQLERMVRKALLIDWLLEDQKRILIEEINVDEDRLNAEIKSLENEKRAVRARLILTQTKEKAEEALAMVRSGSLTFQQAATQYSDDKRLAELGGDVGYIERGLIERELEEVVFKLNVGEVSNVFKTSSGFNVARVEEIQLWKDVPDRLRESILKKTGVSNLVELLNQWKLNLFTNVDVEYVVPSMAPLR